MSTRERLYAEAARRLYNEEGRLEFDDDPVVSAVDPLDGDEDGAYVQCWRWVDREDLEYDED